jgi:hypothetical protein
LQGATHRAKEVVGAVQPEECAQVRFAKRAIILFTAKNHPSNAFRQAEEHPGDDKVNRSLQAMPGVQGGEDTVFIHRVLPKLHC